MTESRLSQSTVQAGWRVTVMVLFLPPSVLLEAMAACWKVAEETIIGAFKPSHWSMHVASCGTSPVAEISTRSAAACLYCRRGGVRRMPSESVTNTYVHTHSGACIYVYMYVCMYVYMYTYMFTESERER